MTRAAVEPEPLMSAAEARSYLKRGRSWLAEHREEIGYVADGGHPRYRRSDLDAWIARHAHAARPAPEPVARPEPARLPVDTRALPKLNPVSKAPWQWERTR